MQTCDIKMCHTCVLFAEAGHDLRGSFQVSVHVFLPQPPDDHTHPLQGRGEGELSHDANLTGLRRHKRFFLSFKR